jgi:hypothetical protein
VGRIDPKKEMARRKLQRNSPRAGRGITAIYFLGVLAGKKIMTEIERAIIGDTAVDV